MWGEISELNLGRLGRKVEDSDNVSGNHGRMCNDWKGRETITLAFFKFFFAEFQRN